MKKKLLLITSLIALFFAWDNVYALEGWTTENGNSYYYENNTKVVGIKVINGKKYYFDNNGVLKTGFIKIDNKNYFFSRVYNYALKGWVTNSEGTWYQDNEGVLLTGIQVLDGKKYYFDNNGLLKTGFIKIDNKNYFFSRVKKYALTGWVTNSEGTWYQDNNGVLLTGIQEIDGKKYYFDNNGILKTGFIKVNNKNYFFSRVKKYALTGWVTNSEGSWYQQDDGSLLTGRQTVDEREYDFGTNGLVQGFRTVNGKTYYYEPDGTMVKGVQNLCGQKMLFNTITGAFEKIVTQKIVIDVSHHQATPAKGDIDWNKVKNSGKVDGVIVRIGYARTMDSKAKSFISELNRLGIPYGVYLFSYAENAREAGYEADFVIQALKDAKANISNNLGIFYDLESWSTSKASSNNISKQEYHNMITTFYNKVTSATGKRVGVYASKFYIYDRFLPEDKKYVNWVAHYTKGGLSQPTDYNGTYIGWQFTSTGRVNGITGDVDMSLFYY